MSVEISTEADSLNTALQQDHAERAQRIVDDLIQRAWVSEVRRDDGEQAMAALKGHRRFDLMVPLGDALLSANGSSHAVCIHYCQALVELGALEVAERKLKKLLTRTPAPAEQSETLGLLGRISKQRFISRRRLSDINQAITYYRRGWHTNINSDWHGVNMVALQGLGRQLNYLVDELNSDHAIAQIVLDSAVDRDDDWATATEVEMRLAMGDIDGASRTIARLVASDVPVFTIQSLRRQLSEIWRLDETDPLLLELDNRLVGTGELILAGTKVGEEPNLVVERFEKIFGTAQALSYWNLVDALVASESVGKVTDRSGRGVGTAFLVPGNAISESLGADLILVTNAHVISSKHGQAIEAADAQVRFQVTRDENSELLVCDGLTEIWSSPPSECDITLIRFNSGKPRLNRPLKLAAGMPAPIVGAYVSVIGHPGAGELSLSIRGNDLIESNENRMHYLAPTEPGSSGSPVFDQNWELIGVHHAGSAQLPRLSTTGFHRANEATTFPYIRAEYAADHL